MTNPALKIDLTLFRKLFTELESLLNTTETLKNSPGNDKNIIMECVLDLSKASGVASCLAKEATLLVLDIASEMNQMQSGSGNADKLEKILGLDKPHKDFKFGGNGNGGFGSQN